MFGLFKHKPASAQPLPEQWEAAERDLPFLDRLSDPDRRRLRELAIRFLDTKQFYGANGLELTDGMLLKIALQACLLVLNIGLEAYRGWLGIIVYPGEIVIPRSEMDENGLVHEFDDIVLGEAWSGGPVLLSWFDEDEEWPNVILHEFAHKLDMANGEADGFPALHADMSRADWAKAFTDAFEALQAELDAGKEPVIDPYAAEHPAEFFAVTSEVFFENPTFLRQTYPAVYHQLTLFYRQDPAR